MRPELRTTARTDSTLVRGRVGDEEGIQFSNINDPGSRHVGRVVKPDLYVDSYRYHTYSTLTNRNRPTATSIPPIRTDSVIIITPITVDTTPPNTAKNPHTKSGMSSSMISKIPSNISSIMVSRRTVFNGLYESSFSSCAVNPERSTTYTRRAPPATERRFGEATTAKTARRNGTNRQSQRPLQPRRQRELHQRSRVSRPLGAVDPTRT